MKIKKMSLKETSIAIAMAGSLLTSTMYTASASSGGSGRILRDETCCHPITGQPNGTGQYCGIDIYWCVTPNNTCP